MLAREEVAGPAVAARRVEGDDAPRVVSAVLVAEVAVVGDERRRESLEEGGLGGILEAAEAVLGDGAQRDVTRSVGSRSREQNVGRRT